MTQCRIIRDQVSTTAIVAVGRWFDREVKPQPLAVIDKSWNHHCADGLVQAAKAIVPDGEAVGKQSTRYLGEYGVVRRHLLASATSADFNERIFRQFDVDISKI